MESDNHERLCLLVAPFITQLHLQAGNYSGTSKGLESQLRRSNPKRLTEDKPKCRHCEAPLPPRHCEEPKATKQIMASAASGLLRSARNDGAF